MAKDIIIDYKPTPKQQFFHSSEADELLFGGAAGGGKSTAIVMEAFKMMATYPGIECYLFRRTFSELEGTLIKEAKRLWPSAFGKFLEAKHVFKARNGSTALFRHCMTDDDRYLYQGAEMNILLIDEITQFSKMVYDYLKTRLRVPTRYDIKPKVRVTANPGGRGHSWVKALFIDDIIPYEITPMEVYSEILDEYKQVTLQYIPATATDNPHLTKDYIFELEQKPENLKKGLLHGNWDITEGRAFPEFRDIPAHYEDRRHTHVINPINIEGHWRIINTFDWGYEKPFSAQWWAQDSEKRLYMIDELYGGKEDEDNKGLRLDAKEQAARILIKEQEVRKKYYIDPNERIERIADTAVWKIDGSSGESIGAVMAREGLRYPDPKYDPSVRGIKDRIQGKQQFHYRLKFDMYGRPLIYIFNTCPKFIKHFKELILDERNIEDVDTRCEDHDYDAARYLLMTTRPSISKGPVVKRKIYDPLAD